MKIKSLTKMELQIMKVFWTAETSLTISEIVKNNPELSLNTVKVAVNKLSKMGLIEVADIVYSGTVLSRSFKTKVSQEDYVASQFETLKPNRLINSLLGDNSDKADVAELKKIRDLVDSKLKELE